VTLAHLYRSMSSAWLMDRRTDGCWGRTALCCAFQARLGVWAGRRWSKQIKVVLCLQGEWVSEHGLSLPVRRCVRAWVALTVPRCLRLHAVSTIWVSSWPGWLRSVVLCSHPAGGQHWRAKWSDCQQELLNATSPRRIGLLTHEYDDLCQQQQLQR